MRRYTLKKPTEQKNNPKNQWFLPKAGVYLYLLYNLYLCWGHQRCSKHHWKSDSRIWCIKSVLSEECYSFLAAKWSGTGKPRERLSYRKPLTSGSHWIGSHYHVMVFWWLTWNILVGCSRSNGQMCSNHKRPHFTLFSWQLYQRNQGINGHSSLPVLTFVKVAGYYRGTCTWKLQE